MIGRFSKRRFLIPLVLAAAVIAVIAAIASGGDEDKGNLPAVSDPDPEYKSFRIGAEPSRFSGSPPMKVQFAAKPFAQSGDVRYFWSFDDGFTTTQQNPTHVFKEPGYYLVTVEAIDGKKRTFTSSIYLGVWSKRVLRQANQNKIDRFAEARKQLKRTEKRRRTLQRKCKRSPDCRKRQELFKKADIERRKQLHADCLKRPDCRGPQLKADRKNCRKHRNNPKFYARLKELGFCPVKD